MVPSSLNYADFSITLRPPRVAIVIDGGPDWTFWARVAAYEMTHMWGGAGFILIPHTNGQVHPALMAAATAYDPDFVVTLRRSLGLIEQINPGSTTMNDESGNPITGNRREIAIESSKDLPLRDQAAEVARASVVAVCSVYRRNLGGTFGIYEDIQILDVNNANENLPRVDVTAKGAYLAASPQWSGAFGVAASLAAGLVDFPSPSIDTTNPSEEIMTSVLNWAIGRASGRRVRAIPPSLAVPSVVQSSLSLPTAYQAASLGIASVMNGHQHPKVGLIVLGNSADDCALALAYERIYGIGIWLPDDWTVTGDTDLCKSTRLALDQVIQSQVRNSYRFSVTSLSRDSTEVSALRDVLIEPWISTISVTVNGSPLETDSSRAERVVESQPPWPTDGKLSLAMADEFDQRVSLPVATEADGSIAMLAPPPAPMIRDKSLASLLDLAWHADVSPLEYNCPSGKGLAADAMLAREADKYLTWIRSGRNGVSFQAKRYDFTSSATPIEVQLARPRLRFPGLFSWASSIARSSNHSVRYSDAGMRAELLSKMWGSRRDLSAILSGPLLRALRMFDNRGTSTREAFPEGGGCFVSGLGAFLSFEGFCKYWDAEESLEIGSIRAMVDSMTEIGVLRRGLLLLCPVCTRPWFCSIDALGQANICPRCGSQSSLAHRLWKHPIHEPIWYYDLHPAAREMIRHNGVEPLLLSNFLLGTAKRYADIAEVDLKAGAKTLVEADLLACRDGSILVAEVKTTDSLGSTKAERDATSSKKMLAAKLLHADEVMFATTASEWDSASINSMREAVSTFDWGHRPPPRMRLVMALGSSARTEVPMPSVGGS